jgi:hypothetical protein
LPYLQVFSISSISKITTNKGLLPNKNEVKTYFNNRDVDLKTIDMPAKTSYNPEKIRKQKRAIGIIAVTLLLLITVLAILMHTSFIIWVLADLIVAGVANLLLRRVGSRPL